MRRLGLFHAARAKSAPCVFEGTVNPARCPRLHFREGGINVKLAKSPSRVPALGGGGSRGKVSILYVWSQSNTIPFLSLPASLLYMCKHVSQCDSPALCVSHVMRA